MSKMKADQQPERLVELEPGLAIWRIPIDCFREQEINARVMSPDKFERLVENIKENKRLESLPLVIRHEHPGSPDVYFLIISGHHRIRAARKALVLNVHAIVIEEDLSKDKILAKQLAHNALQGQDDTSVLKQIYGAISDLNERIKSGITDQELEAIKESVKSDGVEYDIETEVMNLVFLPKGKEKFDNAISLLDKDAPVYVADRELFDKFKKALQAVSKWEDIRNLSAIVLRMSEIIIDFYKGDEKRKNPENFIALSALFHSADMPKESAEVVREAMSKLRKQGRIDGENAWRAIEELAADFLTRK